jgi:signal peptidase I
MRKYVRVTAWTVVILGAIVGGLRATVLEWFTVPVDDPSMAFSAAPALAAGDTALLWRGAIDPGDLVRCTDPDEPLRYVYGRVLARGGEVVELQGQEVKVDGKRPMQETVCTEAQMTLEQPSGDPITLDCGMEAFRGAKYPRLVGRSPQAAQGTRTITVPTGKLFLVSDNRAFPMDSREYGSVSKDSCSGTFFFRLWGKAGVADAARRFTYVH